jgi:hypothetical protein
VQLCAHDFCETFSPRNQRAEAPLVFPDQTAPGGLDVRTAVDMLNGVWTFVFLASFAAALRWRWRAFSIAPIFALLTALAAPLLSQAAAGQPVSFAGPDDVIAYLIAAFYPAIAFILTGVTAVVLGLITRVLVRALQPSPMPDRG